MRTLVLGMTAAVAVALSGMVGASAAPADGVAISKAAASHQDTQQVRYRPYYHHHYHGYRHHWGYQPRYEPFFRLGPVWCC
jgi:hypothetical protein